MLGYWAKPKGLIWEKEEGLLGPDILLNLQALQSGVLCIHSPEGRLSLRPEPCNEGPTSEGLPITRSGLSCSDLFLKKQ